MSRRRALLVSVAAAGGSVVAIGLVLALVHPADDGPPAAATARARVALIQPAKRKLLPDLHAKTLVAPPTELRLSDLRGEPAYVDVWASWCVPCREEAPMIAPLWRQHGHEIRFVGIDTQDGASEGRAFVREFGLDFPHLFDPKSKLATRLGVYGIPTMFLVDRQGRIAAVLVGKQGERRLEQYLRLLSAEH